MLGPRWASKYVRGGIFLLAALIGLAAAIVDPKWLVLGLFAAGAGLVLLGAKHNYFPHLFVLAIPLFQQKIDVAGIRIDAPLAVIATGLFVVMLKAMLRSWRPPTRVPYLRWCVLMNLLFLPSFLKTPSLGISLKLFFASISITIILYFLTYSAMADLSPDRLFTQIQSIAFWWIAWLGVTSLLGFAFHRFAYFGREPFPRFVGLAQDPNFLSSMIAPAFPLGLAVLMINRDVPQRLVILSSLIICFAALSLTFSRAGYLALFLSVAVFGVLVLKNLTRFRAKTLLQIVVGLGLVALIVSLLLVYPFSNASPFISERVASILSFRSPEMKDASLRARARITAISFDMIKNNPVLGVGLGTFTIVLPSYGIPLYGQETSEAHNTFLRLWAETGIVGFSGYFLLVLLSCLSLFKACAIIDDNRRKLIVIGVTSLIFGAVFHNATLDHLLNLQYWFFLAIAMALREQWAFKRSEVKSCFVRKGGYGLG